MIEKFLRASSIGRVRIEIERVARSFKDGTHRSVMSGHGTEFRGINEYDPSNPLARIDWMASARSEDDSVLVVRDFHPEREISVVCAIEDCASMCAPERKQEYAVFLAWLFALSAFAQGDRCRFVGFGRNYVEATGWSRTEESLRASSVENLNIDLFQYLSQSPFINTLLVIISDFGLTWSDECTKLQRFNFQKQNIRCVFTALDEWADFVPMSALATFKQQNGATAQLDLREGKGVDREAKNQRAHFEALRKKIRPLGASFVSVPLARDSFRDIQRELLKHGF